MNRIAFLMLALSLAPVLCWAAEPTLTRRRRLPKSRNWAARSPSMKRVQASR